MRVALTNPQTFFLDTLNYMHQNSKNFKWICSVTEVSQPLYKLKRSTLGNCALLRINNGHMRTKTDLRQWRSEVLPRDTVETKHIQLNKNWFGKSRVLQCLSGVCPELREKIFGSTIRELRETKDSRHSRHVVQLTIKPFSWKIFNRACNHVVVKILWMRPAF